MPSDAFMEISDPLVWGETYDDQFGMGPAGRKQGAFEITSFDLDIGTDPSGKNEKTPKGTTTTPGSGSGHSTPPPSGGGSAATSQPQVKTFSITKFIDKASPDLFLACCNNSAQKDSGSNDYGKMKWAIITVREMGEVKHKPYLQIEFQGLYVEKFTWDLDPGAAADSAGKEEKVTFSFETILIKYSRQDKKGEHHVVKIKAFNAAHPGDPVLEIPWSSLGLQQE